MNIQRIKVIIKALFAVIVTYNLLKLHQDVILFHN